MMNDLGSEWSKRNVFSYLKSNLHWSLPHGVVCEVKTSSINISVGWVGPGGSSMRKLTSAVGGLGGLGALWVPWGPLGIVGALWGPCGSSRSCRRIRLSSRSLSVCLVMRVTSVGRLQSAHHQFMISNDLHLQSMQQSQSHR